MSLKHERTERDSLIISQINLVRAIAAGLRTRLPQSIELEELVGWGMVGLVRAADSFDAGRGIPFAWWVRQKVRGAILDSLGLHGEAAPTREPYRWAQGRRGLDLVAQQSTDGGLHDGFLSDTVYDCLTERERQVLQMLYGRGMTGVECSRVLSISPSWVSECHQAALRKLRDTVLQQAA
jgi:RNA polymerase sigma factor (sigma-70 family)